MGEKFEKARVFVKTVTDVFEKADGDLSKCPRCKGNGLNSGQQFWNRNQSTQTTESCWFCEGVGVMPVIGLNGFMFGRSKAIINTKNVNPLPELPMKMHLYLGKYPETKCTVKTYKPSLKLADMLYDRSRLPSWMNGADGGAMLSGFESSAESSEIGYFPSLLTSSTTKSSEPSNQRPLQTGTINSSRNRVSVSLSSFRDPNSSTSRTPQNSSYRVLSSEASSSSLSIEQKTNRRARAAPRRSGGSLLVTVRKIVGTSLSPPLTSARHGALTDLNPGNSRMTRKFPLLRTSRSRRFPRRERNRVREEAEKDAVQRSYKFQKPGIPNLEARSSAVSDSPDSKQSGGDKIEHFSNLSLQGGIDFGNGQNPWRKMIVSTRKISSDLTTINQLTLGKVKDGIVRTPTLGKAF